MEEVWREQLRTLPVESVRDCLLCVGVAGERDHRWYRHLGLVEPYDILRCPRCRLRWLSPRPDVEGYRKLYSSEMYFGGTGASPADYKNEARARVDYWRARVRNAVAVLGSNRPSTSFLDYGAATGEFVRVALEENHACVGMELSADARAEAKVRNGVSLLSPDQLEAVNTVRFDVIHMNHVLEHMPNPLAHLRWCADRLEPGGLLILEVPQQFDNDLDRLRRWLHLGGRRAHFDAYSLHHTYFFNPATMAMLLGKSGFMIKSFTTFNRNKAPLWPPVLKNWVLRPLLSSADALHQGGNIIEVYATKV